MKKTQLAITDLRFGMLPFQNMTVLSLLSFSRSSVLVQTSTQPTFAWHSRAIRFPQNKRLARCPLACSDELTWGECLPHARGVSNVRQQQQQQQGCEQQGSEPGRSRNKKELKNGGNQHNEAPSPFCQPLMGRGGCSQKAQQFEATVSRMAP